jgi:hypothetical protein
MALINTIPIPIKRTVEPPPQPPMPQPTKSNFDFTILKRIYPDLYNADLGISTYDAKKSEYVQKALKTSAETDWNNFVTDLFSRKPSDEQVGELFNTLEIPPETTSDVLGQFKMASITPERQNEVYSNVFPGLDKNAVIKTATDNYDTFIKAIQAKGKSQDTVDLLTDLGMGNRILDVFPDLAYSYPRAKLLSNEGMNYSDYIKLSQTEITSILKQGETFERFSGKNGEDLIRIKSPPNEFLSTWRQGGEVVTGTITQPLFMIGNIGISISDIAGLAALGYGIYQGVQSLIPLLDKLKDKTLQALLNTGLDKWITKRSMGVPPQQFKTVQNGLYNFLAKDRIWLQEEARNNMLRRQGLTPNVNVAAQQAVDDTINSVESRLALIPKATQTGALQMGGVSPAPINPEMGQSIANALAIRFDGIQQGVEDIPTVMQFTDIQTGSTFYASSLTEARVNLDNMRAKFNQPTIPTTQTGMFPEEITPKVDALNTLPEPTLEDKQTALEINSEKPLSPAQVDKVSSLFGEYINSPNTLSAFELTSELRRDTRAGQANKLQSRTAELVASGIDEESAMRLAIKETLSGELPKITTDYMSDLTDQMRAVLFNKVYQVLRDDPFEMVSTLTALTNALAGNPIPRELGIKGGSALTRLQRVFGGDTPIMKALDKMSTEHKPLKDIVEGAYREMVEGGNPPTPFEFDELLAKLPTIPRGQVRLIEDAWSKASAEDLPKLFEKKTPEQIAQETLELKLDLSPNYPAQATFEFPIEDAAKQIPFVPRPVIDNVVRVLKQIGWSPVDIGGFIKSMKSSIDMSYWRQIGPLIPGHITRFALSNVDAWKALFSQKSAEADWIRITYSPLYALYDAIQEKQGRDFLRPFDSPKGTQQWKGVEEFGYLTKDRLIPRLTGQIPTVKWSNRAFTTGVNSMSWGVFEDFYKTQLRLSEKYASGDLKLKPDEVFDINKNLSDFALMLADWTGRTSLGKLATAAPLLGNLLYAPRYALGRLIGPRHLFSTNPYVRKQAWKDAALFIGTIGGILLLGKQLGLWDVELDRNSSDFGKARIGNARLDLWSGAQQFVVFFSRLYDLISAPVTGKPATGKSSVTGAEYPLNLESLIDNMIKSKEAPLVGLFTEYITGKDYSGNKLDVKNVDQWLNRFAPMFITDVYESIKEDPKTAAVMSALSFVGQGVQAYTGDWEENWKKLGLPKYSENLPYGLVEPVYDIKDWWGDTASQFGGVDPATITEKKGFKPVIKAVTEAIQIKDTMNLIPNEKLININTDTTKGTTLTQYVQMWKDREKIVESGDIAKLKTFDADERTRNAYIGNISQNDYSLLVKYHSLTNPASQKKFLLENPSISINPREQYLTDNTKENAKLAVFGQAEVKTLASYKQARALVKEYDIPNSAIADYLPPDNIVEDYFKYLDALTTNKALANSILTKNPELYKYVKGTPSKTSSPSIEFLP